jgi:hypothetical protein
VIAASVRGDEITVHVDGAEKIRCRDAFLTLGKGHVGVGVSSSAKVMFESVAFEPLEAAASPQPPPTHVPNFSARQWLGGRTWVFDGDEPILQLHSEDDPSCFAKLRPGYKPQLTFDSHWGIENQGAFAEGKARWTAPAVSGGGERLAATWSARSLNDRFTTRSTMTVGFDAKRGAYTYDIDSQLEVLEGDPFHFRYGFDFEHHTPLDPFRWQYLVARRKNGELYHRPVYPIDPGPQYDLDMTSGLRVWHGRHGEKLHIAPAVEYSCSPGDIADRKCNTAVCAAFYDTGVGFEQQTAPAGTKLRVKYRYTGYPAAETERLFRESKIYDSPTLDPQHHYIFADEWPKLTFTQFAPLSETWIYGRTPFMTAHNQRPTYELVKNCGAGSGFAMKLGPSSFGKANIAAHSPLPPGRYVVTALVKADNVHGPGGRIELEAIEAKSGKVIAQAVHYTGSGTFNWRRQGFAFNVPSGAAALAVALGNAGTGEMLITDVEFRRIEDNEPLPGGVLPSANTKPAEYTSAPEGAVADYRMEEGKGHHVLNYATGTLGHLDLANIAWVTDGERPALKFADNTSGKPSYRVDSGLARGYLHHPAYEGKNVLPVALAGHHGGGAPLKGITLAAWIKPAAEMGRSEHGGKGDVIGYGARRFILSLHGQQAPYQLAARINVGETISSGTELASDRWYHVAMTGQPEGGQWRVRLYLDGKQVGEEVTQKCPVDANVVPSLILGAELFYLHDAWYRGLIGRTLVFERTLAAQEIGELARSK